MISCVERMRQEGILADSKDISAFLKDAGETEHKSTRLLERFMKLERYILEHIPDESICISYKQLNDNAQKDGIDTATEKDIRTLLFFLTIKGYTRKKEDAARYIKLNRQWDMDSTLRRFEKRMEICQFTIEWLYRLMSSTTEEKTKKKGVQFSVIELCVTNGRISSLSFLLLTLCLLSINFFASNFERDKFLSVLNFICDLDLSISFLIFNAF